MPTVTLAEYWRDEDVLIVPGNRPSGSSLIGEK